MQLQTAILSCFDFACARIPFSPAQQELAGCVDWSSMYDRHEASFAVTVGHEGVAALAGLNTNSTKTDRIPSRRAILLFQEI